MYLNSWNWVGRPNDIFIDDQDFIYIAELAWSKKGICSTPGLGSLRMVGEASA